MVDAALDRLSKYTYEVRHNPNCPSPFMIVTTGAGGAIGRPGNLFSYGKTLEECAADAVQKIDDHWADTVRQRQSNFALREMSKFAGLVWG